LLKIVDLDNGFLVCTNSCKEGLGGFLMKEGHVIWYESKKLNEHEINYVTHDLELAAIVQALKMWSHYLLGRIFVLMTDHCGLRHLFDQPKLNSRQARWMALLSEFDFKINHVKGKENRVVDALSKSVKMIHLETMNTYKMDVKERVHNAQEIEAFFKTMKSYLKKDPTWIKYEGYHMLDEDMLTYKKKLHTPSCDELNRFIMDELHKRPYIGHLGYQKMITTNRKKFYWPGFKKDILII
jgi:hypothetical protein